MATCEKCGKDYYTRECLKCKNYNYNTQDIKNMKLNENKLPLKVIIGILLLSTIIIRTIGTLKIQELETYNKNTIASIQEIKARNIQLERKNKLNERLIESFKKNNIELQHKLRSARNNTYKSNKNYTYNTNTNNRTKYSQPKVTNTKYTQPKTTRYKPQKKYNRYSGYLKLISDSEITKLSDNRLKSNSPIYGIYKYNITNASCGNNPKIYKIRNECNTYAPYSTDKIYFSKSNIKSLKNFNTKNYKIECRYNQEHGLMHDCRKKMYKYF